MYRTRLKYFFIFFVLFARLSYSQICGSGTPTFTVNLSGHPDSLWISPNVVRNDTCCGATNPDKCLEFILTLDSNAVGITFNIASGAVPPGTLYYQLSCGPPVVAGDTLCLSGPGPHSITFCKPGNNANTYSIGSIPAPKGPDSIIVRNGCQGILTATGFQTSTILWTSVPFNATYNSYLSCTSGCATVTVTPSVGFPPYVDYQVSGYAQSPCSSSFFIDTVRVYFFTDLQAQINPLNPTICFGSANATLTVTATGGLLPYTYLWSTGSTATSITVGPGIYTVQVNDHSNCPPTTATVTVTSYTVPITANAGSDIIECKSSPIVPLNGSVGNASGGIWSGGGGSFTPTNTTLNGNYTATAGELSSGSVQLYLTTTGNAGCPAVKDSVIINFQNISTVNAGLNATVCANNNLVNLSGNVSGFSTTGQWSTTGNGIFGSTTNLNTTYTPGTNDLSAGFVNIILTITNNGVCPPLTDTLKVTVTPSPTVNAGVDQAICSTSSAALNGIVSGPTTTGIWSTLGSGTFNPTYTALNAAYTPGSTDILNGFVFLVLTSAGNGNCIAVKDTVRINITLPAVVNAGIDQIICSTTGSINLNGNVSGGTTTGIWSSNGTGIFNPNNSTLNGTYSTSASDITNGGATLVLTSTVNGPCAAKTDTIKLIITKLAVVNAGIDQTICSTTGSINLNGNISGGTTTGTWNSNGTGVFNPNNTALNGTYAASLTDITNGGANLILTSTNNGPCSAVTDTMKLIITKLALVNAGTDQTICSTTGSINLNGNISSGTTTGIWSSSGNGTFNPNITTLNGTYNTSATDIANGGANLILTSTNNGPCPAVTDTMKLIITKLATVNAGFDQTICSTTSNITLNGNISGGTTTGIWSSNGSGFYTPNNVTLNTVYTTTVADINNGGVTFVLTSSNNGPCPAKTDTIKILLIKSAVILAGPDQSICSTTTNIILNGNISGGTATGIWSGNGSGTYNPNNTILNAIYSITAADINNNGVTFVLTSTNNGPCVALSDTMKVIITKPSTALAGSNQTLCSTVSQVQLNGTIVGGAGTGAWNSNGTGTFNPSNINLTANYIPSVTDLNSGTVILTLTTTNTGGCPASISTITILFIKPAVVNAGLDKTICSTTTNAALAGSVTGGTNTGIWNSSGTGIFNPNSTTLNGSYNPSASDITSGVVFLTLTSTNNGPCSLITDTLILTIITNPKINPITDTAICSNQKPVLIHANVTGGSGTIHWATSGTGTFSPNNSSNPVNYFPSNVDIANGIVTLTISSINNGPCGSVSAAVHITIHPSPTAGFTPSHTTAYIPNDPLTFNNHSVNANNYFWNFGDGTSSNQISPVHNFINVGYYTVTLIATNQYGCSDSAKKEITVSGDIQFPNVFTPNPDASNGGTYNQGDYSNNVFFPYTAGVVDYHLMIFNRLGELIFESFDVHIGWDGYYRGKLCQQDAYVWKAYIKFFDGRTFNKVGNVTLLR